MTTGTARSTAVASPVDVTLVGGPTVVIDVAGLRLLTDPTFDAPGEHPVGQRVLTKTAPPALSPDEVGAVAAVLLSHDQHPDNLDAAGRDFLGRVPLVLTTPGGATRVAGARGLRPFESVVLDRPDGGTLTVTAVPALHGPAGCEPLTGEVAGFVLAGEGVPTTYVSGDNASLDLVSVVAARFDPVELAVLFAGAARTPLLGEVHLTLTSAMAAEAARLLGSRRVAVVHTDGWSHFTEPGATVAPAFAAAGLADRLVATPPGLTVRLS
jgi:L-ascorbate metabolism protein UlaG (beta-lactamase superfamily)